MAYAASRFLPDSISFPSRFIVLPTRVSCGRSNTSRRKGCNKAIQGIPLTSDPRELSVGPETYLRHIARAKETGTIPVVARLNGSTSCGWISFAKQIQQAGADALELNP